MFAPFFVRDQDIKEQEELSNKREELENTSDAIDAYWNSIRNKRANTEGLNSGEMDKSLNNLNREALMAKIRNLEANSSEPVKVEPVNQKINPSIIENTKASLISFKDISTEMINELEVFGEFKFIKFANLEIELSKLKNTLSNLTSKQNTETAKITETINLHQEIVNKFEQIKNLNNEYSQKTSENLSLAKEDVVNELMKLKEERDAIPEMANTEKITIEKQIQDKTLELRELHKDATSTERRDQILSVLSILIKIQKITNATEEVKALTNKLDPEKLEMLLKQLNLQGFLFVMTSKRKTKKKNDKNTAVMGNLLDEKINNDEIEEEVEGDEDDEEEEEEEGKEK